MAALVCVFLQFLTTYVAFLLLLCALYFFQAPIIAFVDTMAIEDGRNFGSERKWGAVGFAAGVFLAGEISEKVGLHIIFYLYICCFILFAATVYFMSAGSSGDNIQEERSTVSKSKTSIFKNREYMTLVVCVFFIGGTTMANNTYFSFLFLRGGGSLSGVGFAFLLMALSEAPFMASTEKLIKKLTLEKTLLFSMFVLAARYAWYASCPQSLLLTGTFMLQGMTTGIILVGFIKYIAKVVDPHDLGFAISIYYAFGSSMSTILCQMAGGILLDHFGAGAIYAFFACMNVIGIIVYLIGKMHRAVSLPDEIKT
jgi:PPP family 3-phenylpropionic acid transporter